MRGRADPQDQVLPFNPNATAARFAKPMGSSNGYRTAPQRPLTAARSLSRASLRGIGRRRESGHQDVTRESRGLRSNASRVNSICRTVKRLFRSAHPWTLHTTSSLFWAPSRFTTQCAVASSSKPKGLSGWGRCLLISLRNGGGGVADRQLSQAAVGRATRPHHWPGCVFTGDL